MIRFLIPALTAAALLTSHAVMGAESRDLTGLVRPFFEQHCTKCHDSKKQKGDLRVDKRQVSASAPLSVLLVSRVVLARRL